jgi:hypothetical protein
MVKNNRSIPTMLPRLSSNHFPELLIQPFLVERNQAMKVGRQHQQAVLPREEKS